MRLLFSTSLFLIIVFMFFACKKQSTFTGKVINSADDSPIDGASVTLAFTKNNKGVEETVAIDETTTNSGGEYALEVESGSADHGFLIAEKNGFAPIEGFVFDPGDCGEQDFVLNPYDAWLSVTVENTSSSAKQFYYNHTGPFLADKIYAFNGIGPFPIGPQAMFNEIGVIPGGATVYVNWDIIRTGNIPFKNKITVFCNRNDTTFVHIKI